MWITFFYPIKLSHATFYNKPISLLAVWPPPKLNIIIIGEQIEFNKRVHFLYTIAIPKEIVCNLLSSIQIVVLQWQTIRDVQLVL